MKKWISFIVTLVMLMSCLAAWPAMAATTNAANPGTAPEEPAAQEPAAAEPAVVASVPAFTCDLGLSVDEQTVSALLSSAGLGDDLGAKIVTIINNIGLKAVSAGEEIQVQLLLKGGPVATLLVKTGENGINIGSDLFPNTVLSVPAEFFNQIAEQLTSGLQGIDMNAVAEAVAPHVEAFMTTIQSKIGDPEATDFTYEGVQFTARIPINITTKELATALLTLVKDILAEESLAPLLSKLNVQVTGLDEALQNIADSKDEEIPVTEASLYANENGDGMLALVMTKDDQAITLYAGMLQNKVILRADALSQMKLDLTVDLAAMALELNMNMNNQGMEIGLAVTGQVTETGFGGDWSVSMNGAPVAKISLNIAEGGEVTAALDPEGKTVVSLTDLQNSADGEAAQALLTDIQTNGLSALLANALQQMPEEVTALLSAMTGATQTVTAP